MDFLMEIRILTKKPTCHLVLVQETALLLEWAKKQQNLVIWNLIMDLWVNKPKMELNLEYLIENN